VLDEEKPNCSRPAATRLMFSIDAPVTSARAAAPGRCRLMTSAMPAPTT
jgi:hypothetical protein